MTSQVLLEFVGVRNLPEDHKGKLYVSFSKSQPDTLFDVKRKLNIFSDSGKTMVASFQCEPKGKLLFELVSNCPSSLPLTRKKVLGSTSLSLQDYLDPVSKLSEQQWLDLAPHSGHGNSKPISLLVAISFTVPTTAPYTFDMVRPRPSSRSSCLFPFPERVKHAKTSSRIIRALGMEVFTLQMRYINMLFHQCFLSKQLALVHNFFCFVCVHSGNRIKLDLVHKVLSSYFMSIAVNLLDRSLKKDKLKENSSPMKEVTAIMKSGKEDRLAEFLGTRWSILDSQWSLLIQTNSTEEDYLCELVGLGTVFIY